MKRNSAGIITGAVLLLLGLFIVLKAVGLIEFSLFFDGWWTVFIIVPCLVGIINSRGARTPFVIGLGVGVLLLCCSQGWIRWGMFAPTLLAVVLVVIGLRLIIGEPFARKMDQVLGSGTAGANTTQNTAGANGAAGGFGGTAGANGTAGGFGGTAGANGAAGANGTAGANAAQTTYTFNPNTNTYDTNNVNISDETSDGSNANNANFNRGSAYNGDQNYGTCVCTAVLSGRDIRYDGEVFRGAMLSAFLGGIELDLRNAIITGQVTIEAKALLGGIDIWVPTYVRTVVNGTPILGGIENGTRIPVGANEQTPVVIINATCALGGIEVK